MVGRRATAGAERPGSGKGAGFRRRLGGIGKAFVRPGALARYVDAGKRTGRRTLPLPRGLGVSGTSLAVPGTSGTGTGTGRPGQPRAGHQLQKRDKRGEKQKQRGRAGEAGRAPRRTAMAMSPKLASLPSDILTRALCCMKHQEIPPLMRVCRGLADAAKTAVSTHFNFLTPEPKRAARETSVALSGASHGGHGGPVGAASQGRPLQRAGGGGQASSSRVFGSASAQPTPRAPRRRRRNLSQRKRKRKSKRLVFPSTSETSGQGGGAAGQGEAGEQLSGSSGTTSSGTK